jgi:hypothetical protein
MLVASRSDESQPRSQNGQRNHALQEREEAGFPHGEPPVARLNLRIL